MLKTVRSSNNLEDRTKQILSSRDRNFVENRRKLEYKQMYVQHYYDNIIPDGTTLKEYKVIFRSFCHFHQDFQHRLKCVK